MEYLSYHIISTKINTCNQDMCSVYVATTHLATIFYKKMEQERSLTRTFNLDSKIISILFRARWLMGQLVRKGFSSSIIIKRIRSFYTWKKPQLIYTVLKTLDFELCVSRHHNKRFDWFSPNPNVYYPIKSGTSLSTQ